MKEKNLSSVYLSIYLSIIGLATIRFALCGGFSHCGMIVLMYVHTHSGGQEKRSVYLCAPQGVGEHGWQQQTQTKAAAAAAASFF